MIKIVNENKQYDKPDYHAKKRLLRVFIKDASRPINNGNIAEDFSWRREVNYSDWAQNKEIISFISEYLKLEPEKFKIKFDRYAGCSMCPCSPGLIVKSTMGAQIRENDPAIWIKKS